MQRPARPEIPRFRADGQPHLSQQPMFVTSSAARPVEHNRNR